MGWSWRWAGVRDGVQVCKRIGNEHRRAPGIAAWVLAATAGAQSFAAAPAALMAGTATVSQAATAATAAAASAEVPADSALFARQVLASGDAAGRPFAIVDKRAARLVLYTGSGRLWGVTPVLLGRASGDRSARGVGQRTQLGLLRPDDTTTAAGRYASVPGHNRDGEDVVWVDYEAAFAIHRLRADAHQADRADRLATADPRRSRVSAGCVVVPTRFFIERVAPLLGHSPGVVYVLPEERPASALWEEIGQRTRRTAGASAFNAQP